MSKASRGRSSAREHARRSAGKRPARLTAERTTGPGRGRSAPPQDTRRHPDRPGHTSSPACRDPGKYPAGSWGGSSGPCPTSPSCARKCITWAPKPPAAPSSMVISTSCSRARRRIRSVSSGLAKRASAMVARGRKRPCAPAASSTWVMRAPKFRMAIPEPSLTMRPLPISSGTPSAGREARALAARIAQGAGPVVDHARRWPPCGSARPRPTGP